MTRSIQELLHSIATGGPILARVHSGRGIVSGPFVHGLWERGMVQVEQRPGEHPGLWDELQTTIARLSKSSSGASAGAHSAEAPMPYHRQASIVAARLGNTVVTWARVLADAHPHLELSAVTVPEAARWMSCFPSLMEELPAYGEMLADIQRVVGHAERVIDRAPDRIFVGICGAPLEEDGPRCAASLYARVIHEDEQGNKETKAAVGCRECRAVHDVAERQAELSRQLADQLVTAAEAAPVLAFLAKKRVTANNIAAWKRDGRVAVHEGRWPYRFGDLLVLAREMRTRDTKPRAKAGEEGSAA